jgi:hypothetical protein
MKTTPKKRSVKLSVSMDAETLEWVKANELVFGSVSGAIAIALDKLKRDVVKSPDTYTIRPIPPKAPRKP